MVPVRKTNIAEDRQFKKRGTCRQVEGWADSKRQLPPNSSLFLISVVDHTSPREWSPVQPIMGPRVEARHELKQNVSE